MYYCAVCTVSVVQESDKIEGCSLYIGPCVLLCCVYCICCTGE